MSERERGEERLQANVDTDTDTDDDKQAQWDTTTPFSTAIGPLGTVQSGMRTLAFRTCKADVVVGLPEGVDEKLRGDSPARKWAWGGKWAVVQFWDGKQ